ncbi:beta-lactamase regulator AmpE [Cronobacter sakazakii]|uniref:Beta-lactamase regulator AmpE n=2 Tax=Cronobacter sakazakii TaxID=28141 RepID=A0AAN5X203_CROSK|nr:beta-lactamase regulator AmpE [Cronobacter sakazakii]EGT4276926.1 beta-lactamase regulator AmpE [Cronobacter sakazakii]EGT5694172.1 beta-lactamase regulator AmpE [Cronobacter sakazakii]EGT5703485.1 beta-lactamase regulator AmpE [Cronobacter sakazakii]EGT5719654.1 beta-lactamase regulator AmpE [Cronobacter sakazakii]EGT5722173.1 beta-lactamase regulator AmpE [Cronobacter sakazakii]
MTLFTLLLVLIAERLFKLGEHWQLDHRLEPLFRRVRHFSLFFTLGMAVLAMLVVFLCLNALEGWFFNVPLLIFWILIGVLCIGAGGVRRHYHAYLKAASQDDSHARENMAYELTLIHGVPPGCDEREYLRELQNGLLWINYRFYLAPMFWFVVGGMWGPVTLTGYAFLRAWQSWVARHHTPHQRLLSGIDAILHVLDWVPVRLAGVVYALVGHGEKALPVWFASLLDRYTSQYQVLTGLAQFALAREPHVDKVATPKAAVSMAKKATLVIVVVVALLTIYGTLM